MLAANRRDPRHFYTSQAIPRTFMGYSPETGPSGYGMRLAALPKVTIGFGFDAGLTTQQLVGDLPAGLVLAGKLLNFRELTSGTIALVLLAAGDDYPEVVLIAAGDLTNVAAALQTLTGTDLLPLPVARTLAVTVTGGTDGEFAHCALDGYLVDNGWF